MMCFICCDSFNIKPFDLCQRDQGLGAKTHGLNLAEKQAEAVRKVLQDKILIITGGPGKSFLLNAILKIVSRLKAKILLAAPTGMDAKRMQESTGY